MANPSPRAPAWLRLALPVAIVALLLGVAILWLRGEPFAPAPILSPASPPAAEAPARPAPGPALPAFDTVLVSPEGRAVLAGRAAPGAMVTVQDHGRPLGAVKVDPRGEWVLTPDAPLPSGDHVLTLTERLPDGSERRGETPALVLVPKPMAGGGGPEKAEAVLVPPEGAPRRLGPAGQEAGLGAPGSGSPDSGAGAPGLDALAYGAEGIVSFSGHAPPGAVLAFEIDGQPAGEATAGANGVWTLPSVGPIPPGAHHLTIRPKTPGAASVSIGFERLAPEPLASATTVTVRPGHTLWRLARQAYGAGPRYVAIFQANHRQIRDPSLIYPGQVLVVPSGAEVSSPPAPPASYSSAG
jgi:nucleoid-associated protein YgaU